jgi:DNA-binding NtrC family response regulator
MTRQTLVAWIGATDLRASRNEIDGLGPIGNAVETTEFDEIALLCNYPKPEADAFVTWLEQRTDARISSKVVSLSSPMNYGEVYEAADALVSELCADDGRSLVFHLSPGTSAMAAIWLILATSKYDAELIASSPESGVYTPEFPFALASDYLPRRRAALAGRKARQAFEATTEPAFDKITHRCAAMQSVVGQCQRVAQFDVPVLLLGETGTGKELFAKAIHRASPRAKARFVPVNCGAIPPDLIESELFGHLKGAFTNAKDDRSGLFESAHGGTLFLDEMGELPLPAQVKLLRVLQTGEIRKVGSDEPIHVDVRIIAATHRDLTQAVEDNRFREDLLYRLAIAVIRLPPLRDRAEDLTLLADQTLSRLQTQFRDQNSPISLTAAARNALKRYPWPGNVRELMAVLTRAVLWSETGEIDEDTIEASIAALPTGRDAGVLDRPIGDDFDLQDVLNEVRVHYMK